LHALAEVMERARIARLTHFQHILLRVGEWIAYAESAAALARRAARMAEGKLSDKASRRFDAAALAAISRIFAREAAMRVAEEGLKWTVGAGGETPALDLPGIHRAQAGLVSDMDFVADALYGRAAKAAARVA
jgi:alkylation response protein AidB-like acyl-CoA dehydrogenase